MPSDGALTSFWLVFVLCGALSSARSDGGSVDGDSKGPLARVRALLRRVVARGKVEDATTNDLAWFSNLTVPHRWFTHFYVVGCAVNARALADALGDGGARARARSLDVAAAIVVLVLFQAHLIRRLCESALVAKHRPEATMHAGAYALGLTYYSAATRSLAGAALGVGSTASAAIAVAPSRVYIVYGFALIGVALFAVGNYRQNECHRILARARRAGSDARAYVIPRGGWFERFSCAHFTAEVVIYFGLILIVVPSDIALGKWSAAALAAGSGGALAPVALCAAVVANLTVAARDHHAWYLKRFHDAYPKNRTAIFPRIAPRAPPL